MKNILVALLVLGTGLVTQAATLADISGKSVVFLVHVNQPAAEEQMTIKNRIYPIFKELRATSFPEASGHFLLKKMSFALELVSLFSGRKVSKYDVLVRLDLAEDLTTAQLQALARAKAALRALPKTAAVMFLSSNYQFHRVEGTEATDVAMAFINEWHPTKSAIEAQSYWFQHHGPLVLEVGLPPVIKSYTQIHVDLAADAELFDKTIQGLSFETITSQCDLVKTFVKNPKLRKLNKILEEDEKNFTQEPPIFAFKAIAL